MKQILIITILSIGFLTSCDKEPDTPSPSPVTTVDSMRLYFIPGGTSNIGYHYMLNDSILRIDTNATSFPPDTPYQYQLIAEAAIQQRIKHILTKVPANMVNAGEAKYVDAYNCPDADVVYAEVYQAAKQSTWIFDSCTDDMDGGKSFADEVLGIVRTLPQ